MGAVWLRANAPSGPTLRARAWKLSVVMSFVAIALLHSTFLLLVSCTKLISVVLSSTRVASISRQRRACQAGRDQTLGGCFGLFADVATFQPRSAVLMR